VDPALRSLVADGRILESLLLHYHITAIHLYEIGFYMPPTTSNHYSSISKLRRADVLHMCLRTTKDWLDVFLPISPKSYFSLTVVHCGQIMYVLAVLSKLSLFKSDDWSLETAKSLCDLATVQDEVIARMEEAASTFESNEENGMWWIAARRLRKMKKFSQVGEMVTQSADGFELQDMDLSFAMDSFDLFDDGFWHGISGSAWESLE
jgi:hypothetical protein